MKKRITAIFVAMAMMITCFVPVTAHANESDFEFLYDSDTKTLTFSGTGLISYEEEAGREWLEYSVTAENLVIEDGITGIGNFAFMSFRKLKNIDFPEELHYIGQQAFSGCDSLKEVHLPDELVSFGFGIFEGCDNLETVYFGMTSKEATGGISDNMFRFCHKLKNIYVPRGNAIFSVKDGVLFSGTTLVWYPESRTDKKYDIPEGTTTLGGEAFSNSAYLEEVNIPDTVSCMLCSFESCSALKSLTIPSSVTSLPYGYVARFCTNIEYIDNRSNAELKFYNGYDSAGLRFWIDRESGQYVDTVANGIVDKVILANHKYKGETIKVDGITYRLTENTKNLTIDEMNRDVSRAQVKAVKFGEEYTTSARVKHKGWYYDVINPEDLPVSKISEASINYTNTRLEKGDYDAVYADWGSVNALGPKVSYKVEYKKHGGKWTVLNEAAADKNCTVKDLDDGAKYYIRVTPHITVNGKTHYGKAKVSTGVYTLKKLNRPNVTKASAGKVKVTWNNINGETGYEIYKSANMNKNFKLAKRVTGTAVKSVVFKVDEKAKYYYKVRAYKDIKVNGMVKKVYGPWSAVKGYKLK